MEEADSDEIERDEIFLDDLNNMNGEQLTPIRRWEPDIPLPRRPILRKDRRLNEPLLDNSNNPENI